MAARRTAITWHDTVPIYVSGSADCLLNLMALQWLGAIPALMNPNIPGDTSRPSSSAGCGASR